ncbi:MAG: AmmeMemoRadiSam system protein B [Spirochaetales bacterium]|nr:AmmeMemoRadiSam system protein B [Spirochaetales bacterium]
MNELSPLVDGLFYPGEKDELISLLDSLLNKAPASVESTDYIVTPHAAYTYCGIPMAAAYKALDLDKDNPPERIIILAPLHREAEPGLYLSSAEGIELPIGRINFDLEAIQLLKKQKFFSTWDVPYQEEPGIEVQLPFVSHLFPDIPVLPIYANVEKRAIQKGLAEALLLFPDSKFIITSNLTGFLQRERSLALAEEFLSAISARKEDASFDPESWKQSRKGGLPRPCGLELLSAFWLYWQKKYSGVEPDMRILSWGPDTEERKANAAEISALVESPGREDKCTFYAGFGLFRNPKNQKIMESEG